jgi:hypothetical protein
MFNYSELRANVGQVAVMRPVLEVERHYRIGQIHRVRASVPHVVHAVGENLIQARPSRRTADDNTSRGRRRSTSEAGTLR